MTTLFIEVCFNKNLIVQSLRQPLRIENPIFFSAPAPCINMIATVIGRSSLRVFNRPILLVQPRRQLFNTAQARNGLRTWKRLMNSEANTTVKAIPVEAVPKAGFSGIALIIC